MVPISPTSHLLWGELISCQKEGGREGVSEVGESRDEKKPEVSLVGWGMEVQGALLTLALTLGTFRESGLWVGLIKAEPGNGWGELMGWLSQGTAGCLGRGDNAAEPLAMVSPPPK